MRTLPFAFFVTIPAYFLRMIIYPLIYILIGVFLFFRQRSMIYFPAAPESNHYAEETISNEGESVKVIILNPGRERAIIYFGGNAETVVYNAPDFLQDFPEHTIYLFNYRSYGGSSGKPSEKGIFSDTLALYDTIKARHTSISAIGAASAAVLRHTLPHSAKSRSWSSPHLSTAFEVLRNAAG